MDDVMVGKKKMHKGYSGKGAVPALKVNQPGGMKKVVRPQGIRQRQAGAPKAGGDKTSSPKAIGGTKVPNLGGAHGIKIFHKGKKVFESR